MNLVPITFASVEMNELNLTVAILTARVLAGILFAFQGYDKLFRVGLPQLSAVIKATLGDRTLPDSFIRFIAFFTSWTELICGVLLIVGLFTPWAIYLLCLDIIIVSAGFSYAKTMWESGHVLFRLVLILFLLMVPRTDTCISLDALLGIPN
jgi:putative oxidoreductase